MGLLHACETWLNRKLKNGTYELEGDEIVAGRGRRPNQRIRAREVTAWQIHMEMGFDVVSIKLADGRVVNWIDTYDDLIGILRRVAAGKEQQWDFA